MRLPLATNNMVANMVPVSASSQVSSAGNQESEILFLSSFEDPVIAKLMSAKAHRLRFLPLLVIGFSANSVLVLVFMFLG